MNQPSMNERWDGGEANPFSGTVPDWARDEVDLDSDDEGEPDHPAGRIEPTVTVEAAITDEIPQPETVQTNASAGEPALLRETAEEYAGATNGAHPSPAAADARLAASEPVESARPAEASSARAVPPTSRRQPQQLTISFRRSGDIERDIFRLKELYERVRDPRGRDRFHIRLESKGQPVTLDFPNDACTVSERLTGELSRHFRVEFTLDEG